MVFRPVRVVDRQCQWILDLKTQACLRVPEHARAEPFWEAVPELQLVPTAHVHLGPLASKLEPPELVHCYVRAGPGTGNATGTDTGSPELRRVEFPRYQLVFDVEDDRLKSRSYLGYHLDLALPDMCILVPDGTVRCGTPVRISVPAGSHRDLTVVQCTRHPRLGSLQAESVGGRLHLAALYTATSTSVPEPGLRRTGEQIAMELVRGSWVTRPLSEAEAARLRTVVEVATTRAQPALALLCRELEYSAGQLAFLHGAVPQPMPFPQATVAAYLAQAKTSACNPHGRLTPSEELRVMGQRSAFSALPHPVIRADLGPCPVPEGYVEATDLSLAECVLKGARPTACPAFPLPGDAAVFRTPVGTEMLSDLQQSWEAHHAAPVPALRPGYDACAVYDFMREGVGAQIDKVHGYIDQAMATVPRQTATSAGTAFLLRREANIAPHPGLADLLRIASTPGLVAVYNPLLSADAQSTVHEAVLTLPQLCVLEDRLTRLAACARRGNHAQLLQELLTRRVWDAATHPKWLVFEVVARLQIRPVQYRVARTLMDTPGAVAQLNIGEGKTRVIVPMLVLHWADGATVVRVCALSTLLPELSGLLHNALCASVLRVRLPLLPFHRDVQLDATRVRTMARALRHCRHQQGLLLVAPEHRLSLHLKFHELADKGQADVGRQLQALLALPTRDLIDESDAILHHKYQMVYAVGSPQPLPEGYSRWHAAQALLRALKHNAPVRTILADPRVARLRDPTPEGFVHCRLIPGPDLEAICPRLAALLDAVLQDPPFEFAWLEGLQARADVRDFVLEPGTTAPRRRSSPSTWTRCWRSAGCWRMGSWCTASRCGAACTTASTRMARSGSRSRIAPAMSPRSAASTRSRTSPSC